MTYTRAVGMRIVGLLEEKNLTKKQLCRSTGLALSTLKTILQEKSKDVKLSTIDIIARGFGMTVQEFCNHSLFNENLGGDK